MLQIPTIIVDIDGTLALGIGDHRKAYDYHLCGKDKPNPVPWAIVEMWSKYHPFGWIIFMSGRENVTFPGRSRRKDQLYRGSLQV